MSVVRVLPDQVVNQIAAGEVVERPASVVKELVENALDAGATSIEVVLKGGGADRIRISDDGSGMDREDAMMCLERHATSKIGTAEDLETIASLGFRGEAIPSIASVSKFTILTRPAELEEGVRVRVEGGTLTSVRAAGCAPGTEIDVAELFFNLPARRKFLRTRATELAHCTEAVVRMALVRPDVRFRLVSDGRVAVMAEPADLASRARQVLGPDASQLVSIDFESGSLKVAGLASPVAVHRPAGKSLYLFVNGRYVRDAVVRRAVTDAYRDRIPKGRHPLVVLDIRLDPALVDVNVHPAKTEVRFRNPRHVQETLSQGIRSALQLRGIERELQAPRRNRASRELEYIAPALPLKTSAPPIPAHPDDDPLLALRPTVPVSEPEAPPPVVHPRQAPAVEPPPIVAEPEPDLPVVPASSVRTLRPIGPFGRRWFLLEGEEGLHLVDFVEADALLSERRLLRDGTPQRLLVPKRERLPEKTAKAVGALAEPLAELGLHVVVMSPTELAIRSVPRVLDRLQLDGLLAKLADSDALERTLARSCSPPDPPDVRKMRSILASLEEAGLDAVVAIWPAAALVKGP